VVWGLADYFIDELIGIYRSREEAERALAAILADEPQWEGMIEVVRIPSGHCGWAAAGSLVRQPRCRISY
jgi:hypothetical protein